MTKKISLKESLLQKVQETEEELTHYKQREADCGCVFIQDMIEGLQAVLDTYKNALIKIEQND